ncbi:gustatory receptor-like 36a [Drosophila bipectinata]|uniref:gustatory receptor-like 36a n=1 Tax=Drosophila bipectinata TaxID=42026 RepID=UPI0038B3779A
MQRKGKHMGGGVLKHQWHRWTILAICFWTYILYRGCVIGQIEYDFRKKRMITEPRNPWITKIACLIKIGLAQMWSQSFVRLANEVIELNFAIKHSMGPPSLEGSHFLIVFGLQIFMNAHEVCYYLGIGTIYFGLSSLLLQLLYNGYAIYLVLLLSWIGTMIRFLEVYRKEGCPKTRRLKLLQLYRFYSRIVNCHKNITQLWLSVSFFIFFDVVILVSEWTNNIYLLFYDHSFGAVEKWDYVMKKKIGCALSLLLRILLVGLCNDRLFYLEKLFQLNLLGIDLNNIKNEYGVDINTNEKRKNQLDHIDLHSQVQSFGKEIIIMNNACGCNFVLNFFFCVLMTALSFVQFSLSTGHRFVNL